MRKLLKLGIVVVAIFSVTGIKAQLQKNEKQAWKSEIIKTTDTPARTSGENSDPMVIGPVLYDQMDQKSTYVAINVQYTAQNFTSYTSYLADDFEVAAGESFEIKYVRTTMYTVFSIDSVDYFNIYVYENNGGKPGALVAEVVENDGIYYQAHTDIATVFDITVTLNENIVLSEGEYWISIQPVTSIVGENAYGDPAFWMSNVLQANETAIGIPAHFQNPGGSYVPIYTWKSIALYWEVNQGVDLGLHNLNFGLYGPEKDYDLTVSQLISPQSGDELSATEDVTIVIQNIGNMDVVAADFKVKFRLNDGAWSDLEDGEDISSGTELYYTFHESADFSAKGIYNVEVEIVYASDENTANNTLIEEIENYGILYPAVPNALVEYTTCEGTLTDHGGLGDVYVSYSDDTVVLYPATENSRIRLEFYDMGLTGAYATRFYNGSSTDAPHLGDWEALNNDEGIFSQEIPGLVVEGTNIEGAVTVIMPGFDLNSSKGNMMASVSCVSNEAVDFKAEKISLSKAYSWENEKITISASVLSRGTLNNSVEVTFYANNIAIGTVTSNELSFGETGTVSIDWTPTEPGNYIIKAEVPADDGNAVEKYTEISHDIFEAGMLVQGFEDKQYPPEGWINTVAGGTRRYFIWYNERERWEGKWNVSIGRDTLITPLMNIGSNDTLEFIYSAGFFGGTCNILYADSPNGPWSTAHSVNYGMPFTINYKAPMWRAEGQHYIAFDFQGGQIDYIRGIKRYFNESDLAITNFNGPIDPEQNQEVSYDLTVRNLGSGALVATDYTVTLWKNIDETATAIEVLNGVDIAFSNYHTFTFNTTFSDLESGHIYATVDYAADQDISNNISESYTLDIIGEGFEYSLIGTANSELIERFALSGFGANYMEMLVEPSEIGIVGAIDGLSIYYDGAYTVPVHLELYLGETDATTLENEFLSTQYMSKVSTFDFVSEYTNDTFKQLYIGFDKPFIYSGTKNLVLAIHRINPPDEEYSVTFGTQATPTSSPMFISHAMQSYEVDTDVSNPDEINALSILAHNFRPNVLFYSNVTNMDASLSGTVTEGTDGLENVLLVFEGYANRTWTNNNGLYTMPVMPSGNDINITASLHGYYDSTKTGSFVSTEASVVDFNLTPLPAVTVLGTIVSDDVFEGIADVEISMSGYDLEYFGLSNADGSFAIDGVLGDKEYAITFAHEMYEEYSTTVSVTYQGANMDTIILNEIEAPAFNVIASLGNDNNVELNWESPYTGISALLDPTLGTDFGTYWYNEPDEDAHMGNLFRVTKPGTVTSIEFSNYAWPGAETGELYIKVFNKDRVQIMEKTAFMMPDSTVDWLEIDVPDFTYTDDFYIMIHWDQLHQQTGAIMSHYHDDNVAYLILGDEWQLLTDVVGAQYSGAFSIRANVIEAGSKSPRALLTYDLWRRNVADIDPANWTQINEEPIVGIGSSVSFTDNTFNTEEPGFYNYTVKANYTNGTSDIVYSSDINKGVFTDGVTVNVTANDGADVTGAKVELALINGSDITTYTSGVVNGSVSFDRVMLGSYRLKVFNGGLHTEYSESVEVLGEDVFNVELQERIYTPSMLSVEVDSINKNAEFTWGLGDLRNLILDNGSFEEALSLASDADAAIGNYFEVLESGQITSVRIKPIEDLANNPNNEEGELTIAFFDSEHNLIGKSQPFALTPDSENENYMQNVPIDFVQFSGSFYAMVQWSSDEPLSTHALGMDTDENPGNAYYYDETEGWVQMASWNMWGNFGIRVSVLVNGKGAEVAAGTAVQSNPKVASQPSVHIQSFETMAYASASSRGFVSYNVYLNEELVANEITGNSFTFTEAEHLNLIGENTYEAGVEAVFVTANSIIASTDFDYTIVEDTTSVPNPMTNVFEMYPNPASNVVTFVNVSNANIEFYNAMGEKVKVIESNDALLTFETSELARGTYIINVQSANGNAFQKLILTE